MPKIELLDQQTIDQIAAGEVVERPSSVVKELVENSIDAGATAVTAEIREGGIALIRVTDNGCGIGREQIPLAFCPHSTSKIRSAEDLLTVSSLGFRGEALSSIAAVAQVELISKTRGEFTGSRYLIEGGQEVSLEEVGAPSGTTFLVKNLFYNTPARKKFLQTAHTEGGYISSLMEHIALSHPEISFKFINNGQVRLHTSGSGKLREIIYHIYGRDIASNLLEVREVFEGFSVEGFIGKPVISRGNRNFESYFVNGRYIRSSLLAKSVEDAYRGYLMQHKFPFAVLQFSMDSDLIDVNVHPNKMELRFSDAETIYSRLTQLIRGTLRQQELIPRVTAGEESGRKTGQRAGTPEQASGTKAKRPDLPEPFEEKRLEKLRRSVAADSPYEPKYQRDPMMVRSKSAAFSQDPETMAKRDPASDPFSPDPVAAPNSAPRLDRSMAASVPETVSTAQNPAPEANTSTQNPAALPGRDNEAQGTQRTASAPESISVTVGEATLDPAPETGSTAQNPAAETGTSAQDSAERPGGSAFSQPVQQTLADYGGETVRLLSREAKPQCRIIGQLFGTYWLAEFQDQFYMIDQHAAHEKVLYERMMKAFRKKEVVSQLVSPPIVLSLTMQEETRLKSRLAEFEKLGFQIEAFGGREYAVSAVPDILTGLNGRELLLDLIDGLDDISAQDTADLAAEKIASMSCKAAVKGRQRLSRPEAEHLMEELLELENPYFCPHGRPVIISMSRYEIEKKFKRIV